MYRKFDCRSEVAEKIIRAAVVFWLYFDTYIKGNSYIVGSAIGE
jgi:hypothetical protein